MGEITSRVDHPLEGELGDNLRQLVQGSIRTITGTSDTLTNDDFGRRIMTTNGSAVSITVPPSLADQFYCIITQMGGGQITLIEGSGVTIIEPDDRLKTRLLGSRLYLDWTSANNYVLSGDTTA